MFVIQPFDKGGPLEKRYDDTFYDVRTPKLSLARANCLLLCQVLFIVSNAAAVIGCSKQLTNAEAQAILETHELLKTLKPVAVEAISQGDTHEAVVRARISDAVLNLKFRRYDTGWQWEFAETKTGGWVSPDTVVQHLLEEQRIKKVAEWAAAHRNGYVQTFKVIEDEVIDYLPRRTDWSLDLAAFIEVRKWLNGLYPGAKPTPAERAKRMAIVERVPVDAWGQQINLSFHGSTPRTATIVSAGADKQHNSADDIICEARGARELHEDGDRVVWMYYAYWVIPEGLEQEVKPFVGVDGKGGGVTIRPVFSSSVQ